jgi:preprotein translocase subunit YajC
MGGIVMFSSVYASTGGVDVQQGGWSLWVMLGFFLVMTYFMIIRPKQKKETEHRSILNTLNKGDEVLTYSGLMGKIVRLKDDYLVLNVAEGLDVKMQKKYVSHVLPKGTLKSI